MKEGQAGMFRSLRNRNYRIWIGSAFVANIGLWMQATAQDWLVLTELTRNSAHAVGIVTALQFAPQLLFVPITGTLADRADRRKVMIVTQSMMGLLSLCLGLLVLSGLVQLWHVYGFALLLGSAMAFDTPARQSFVSELVGEADLPNAVALNGMTFNLARTVGPAIAGLAISLIGTGWVFLVNAASYLVVISGLVRMQVSDLHHSGQAAPGGDRRLLDGFRYVRQRPDILVILLMLFLIGASGLNFPVFISAMSVKVFHRGASEYGLLSSSLAIGAVCGALLAARRERPRVGFLIGGAALFGCGMLLAGAMPRYLFFGVVLTLVGLSVQTTLTSANGLIQMSIDRAMRGRVMAIYAAIMLGGMPLGAPIVGWVADHYGPRWALCMGGAAGLAAALVGFAYLVTHRGLRFAWEDGQARFSIRPDPYQSG